MLLISNIQSAVPKMMMVDEMTDFRHVGDEIPQPSEDRHFGCAPKGGRREVTRLLAGVVVYIALLAGLSLHGLVMPDMNTTSSLGNEIKVPVTDYHRRDRE